VEDRHSGENQDVLLTRLVFDISLALAEPRSLEALLTRCCETLVDVLGVAFVRIWTLSPNDNILTSQASAGLSAVPKDVQTHIPLGSFQIGGIAQSRLPVLMNDVQHDDRVSDRAWAVSEGLVGFAGYPLLAGGQLVGVMGIFSRSAFPESTVQALATIASLAAHGTVREWLKEERDALFRKSEAALKASGRSNEALQRFAAIASHDLQEPLRQITAFSQLLSGRYHDKLDAEANEYIDFIVDGTTRMQRLIKGLLAYAQIEAVSSIRFETANTELALKGALRNLGLAITESNAVISHDPLPLLPGNQVQLEQLFQNLIGNAIKYRGSAPPLIHVSAVHKGNEWIFCVADNGLGIDPEHRARIFQVFTRLHGREIAGIGLGLAFCSKIIELHRGRIWVEANPAAETGSIFCFAIPAASLQPVQQAAAD